MPEQIRYRNGYKYQLYDDYQTIVDIHPEHNLISWFIELYPNGTLFIRRGYAWDGPSGPTVDTANFMRGSLVHDALYQLMREGVLSVDKWRKQADLELNRICIEDGMSLARASLVYWAVRLFGGSSASKVTERKILVASKN